MTTAQHSKAIFFFFAVWDKMSCQSFSALSDLSRGENGLHRPLPVQLPRPLSSPVPAPSRSAALRPQGASRVAADRGLRDPL